MRICTIAFTAVVAGIVLGALFVFSGSATHATVPDRISYSVTATIVMFVTVPADVDKPVEEPPACVASAVARVLNLP